MQKYSWSNIIAFCIISLFFYYLFALWINLPATFSIKMPFQWCNNLGWRTSEQFLKLVRLCVESVEALCCHQVAPTLNCHLISDPLMPTSCGTSKPQLKVFISLEPSRTTGWSPSRGADTTVPWKTVVVSTFTQDKRPHLEPLVLHEHAHDFKCPPMHLGCSSLVVRRGRVQEQNISGDCFSAWTQIWRKSS